MMRFPSIFSFSKLAMVAAVAIFITDTSAALAGAKQLACETDDGQQAADLWIDIENGLFELGVQSYTITNIATRYIIAISSHLNLGGGKVLKEDVGSFSTRTPKSNLLSTRLQIA